MWHYVNSYHSHVATWVKNTHGRKLQMSGKHLQISEKTDAQNSNFTPNSHRCGILAPNLYFWKNVMTGKKFRDGLKLERRMWKEWSLGIAMWQSLPMHAGHAQDNVITENRIQQQNTIIFCHMLTQIRSRHLSDKLPLSTCSRKWT